MKFREIKEPDSEVIGIRHLGLIALFAALVIFASFVSNYSSSPPQQAATTPTNTGSVLGDHAVKAATGIKPRN